MGVVFAINVKCKEGELEKFYQAFDEIYSLNKKLLESKDEGVQKFLKLNGKDDKRWLELNGESIVIYAELPVYISRKDLDDKLECQYYFGKERPAPIEFISAVMAILCHHLPDSEIGSEASYYITQFAEGALLARRLANPNVRNPLENSSYIARIIEGVKGETLTETLLYDAKYEGNARHQSKKIRLEKASVGEIEITASSSQETTAVFPKQVAEEIATIHQPPKAILEKGVYKIETTDSSPQKRIGVSSAEVTKEIVTLISSMERYSNQSSIQEFMKNFKIVSMLFDGSGGNSVDRTENTEAEITVGEKIHTLSYFRLDNWSYAKAEALLLWNGVNILKEVETIEDGALHDFCKCCIALQLDDLSIEEAIEFFIMLLSPIAQTNYFENNKYHPFKTAFDNQTVPENYSTQIPIKDLKFSPNQPGTSLPSQSISPA